MVIGVISIKSKGLIDVNICLFKNRECEHALDLTFWGCKEWGEEEGPHKYTACCNNEIGRDVTKCK